ncbi:MAG: WD40 repeat domain-containing protein [Proteobacteria bacterium]|nr:WD40 repeat domain-containing protein [Pseudomonadota bacterium]
MNRLLPLLAALVACSGPPPVEPTPAPPTPPVVDASNLQRGPAELPAGPPKTLLPGITALAQGRHIGAITSYAVSADGKLLATGAWDGTVRLWEAGSGELLHVLPDSMTEDIEGIAFSPDGTAVAAVSRNSNGGVWDVATGERKFELRLHEDSCESVVWSPDGTLLATGAWDGTVRLWDAATGAKALVIEDAHTEGIFALAFSPAGTHIASGAQEGTTKLWDIGTGVLSREFPPHDASVYSIAFSPDGTRLATGSRDGSARIHLIETGERTGEYLLGEHVLAVAFSDDGELLLAAGWDGRGKLWDTVAGGLLTHGSGWQLHPVGGALRVAFPEIR